jgi:hypothetical protein
MSRSCIRMLRFMDWTRSKRDLDGILSERLFICYWG